MRECVICGSNAWIEKHHVFGGAYRRKSEQYGFTVDLCHYCHNEPGGVHFDHAKSVRLKQISQREFEETHTRDEFRALFGKSYIEEDEA